MTKNKHSRPGNGKNSNPCGKLGFDRVKAENPLPKTEPASAVLPANGDLRAKKG